MDATTSPAFADHLKQLQQRWERALTNTGYDLALVSAGVSTPYLFDDQSPPFRPNPHFAQWFPQRESEHCELIIKPGATPTLLFFSPQDYWHLPPSQPDWAASHFDVRSFDSVEALARARSDALAGYNNIAHISGAPLAAGGTQHNPADLIAEVDYLRARKTAFELPTYAHRPPAASPVTSPPKRLSQTGSVSTTYLWLSSGQHVIRPASCLIIRLLRSILTPGCCTINTMINRRPPRPLAS